MQQASLQTSRASAKRTIQNLIRVHHETLTAILGGQHFFARGEDITEQVRSSAWREINQCYQVLEAIQRMGHGDIKRAAELCEQIQEHIPNAH